MSVSTQCCSTTILSSSNLFPYSLPPSPSSPLHLLPSFILPLLLFACLPSSCSLPTRTAEVFFTQAVIREKEPDQETIDTVVTLRRELLVDYGVQTTVYYRTVPGSATKDEDYIHEDSVLVFHGHQAEAYIILRILPGREWFKQESFSLEIYRVEEGVIGDLGGVVTVIIDGGEGEAVPTMFSNAWHIQCAMLTLSHHV